jgi:hypothetical protein
MTKAATEYDHLRHQREVRKAAQQAKRAADRELRREARRSAAAAVARRAEEARSFKDD